MLAPFDCTQSRRSLHRDLPLFFFLLLVFAYFYQAGFDNLNSHFDLSLSLAFEHRWPIDTFAANTVDKVPFGGHFYSEKAPGISYLALPVPLVAAWFYSAANLPADWLLYFATLASVSALSAFAAVIFRRFLCALNPSLTPRAASARTLAIWLGTLLLPYSSLLFSHAAAASLLLIAAYTGYRARYPLSAVLFGLAVFVEYPAILPASALALALFFRARDRAAFGRAVPFVLLPALALAAHNAICFGSPFSLGYGHLADSQFAGEMTRGFFGVQLPRFDRVLQLLFGTYRGLFFYCPVLLLAVVSFPVFWRRERKLALGILTGALAVLLLNASYGYWQGGVCFGPRHLLPVIPLLALSIAFLPEAQWRNPLARALVALSILINFIPTLTTPFVSEYDTNPLAHSYATLLKAHAIAINPNPFLTPVPEMHRRWQTPEKFSGAWNWGTLAGLHGFKSLILLLSLVLLFLPFLFSSSRDFR